MQFVTSTAFFLVLAKFVSASEISVNDLTWMDGGSDSFQVCSSPFFVAQGICGSGENMDCKNPWDGTAGYSSVGCGSVKGFEKLEIDENNWKCGSHGDQLQCPPGEVIVGTCGSGVNNDCHNHCAPAALQAILCAPAPASISISSGEWVQSYADFGDHLTCKEDQVACGICESGVNHDCGGSASQLKCCDTGNFEVKGSWVYQFSIAEGTSRTMSHGTSQKHSSSWSMKVKNSVKAGLKVVEDGVTAELSTEISTEMASTYSDEWTDNVNESFTINFDKSDQGKAVFQWVFMVNGSDKSEDDSARTQEYAITASKAQPPKCQPGYAAGSTSEMKVSYQECIPGRYLPGFSDSGSDSGRNLRGAAA